MTAATMGIEDSSREKDPPHIPLATYRLQFNSNFTFADATELVPYLAELGISHVYASPYLKARAGSSHGYDITDHNVFNPEIGSAADFDRFVTALHHHGMGQMLDIVPNHMGIMGGDNVWWLDVLENGPASIYADYFDIDWEPLREELRGKVLVPVLGDQYGTVLERGELKLRFDAASGEFSIVYFEHRFPVDPRQYPSILRCAADALAKGSDDSDSALLELQSLITAFGHLPERHASTPEQVVERNRDKEIRKRQLAALVARAPHLLTSIESSVAQINGRPGCAASFDALHELIKAQAFRLAYWRVAADDINYRRFFDINDLAALRMENEAVFEATHRLVLQLVGEGKIDALRIDHPDGLYNPAQYFCRLQQRVAEVTGKDCTKPIYLVIEKIIAGYERIPEEWPVHGTTGYRFANVLNGLFVDTAAERKLTRIYEDFIGAAVDFDELLYDAKRLIMKVALSSELNVLANLLNRIAGASRHTCDFTLNALHGALTEIVACFPVYRTYVSGEKVSAEDRRFIDWAVSIAKRRSHAADTSSFDFVRDMLLISVPEQSSARYKSLVTRFAMKFQQVTGPVMAKGMEDTSFYRYNRLLSLNEVGGDPRSFGMTLSAFHGATQDRLRHWPHTMLATSTHDGKRSEDLRARIDVLTEMPAAWRLYLRRWRRLNRSKKRVLDGERAPSRNDEYLLYQTLLGAWPVEQMDEEGLATLRARIGQFMLKAVREAKLHTSWTNPDAAYEEALEGFIDAVLAGTEKNLFLADFLPAQKRIARFGMLNSLSQTLVKLASPGVPDIYQGTELWDFSLVDPDNRRPVDYARRRRVLADLQALATVPADALLARLAELVRNMDDGRAKLYLVWRTLQARAAHHRLFLSGDYQPLTVTGSRGDEVCAFARQYEGEAILVVAPRFFARRAGDADGAAIDVTQWYETDLTLPPHWATGDYSSVLTGERWQRAGENGRAWLSMPSLLAHFPVALLHVKL